MVFGFTDMVMLVKICAGTVTLVRGVMGMIFDSRSSCCLTRPSQTSTSTFMPGYLFSSIHPISPAIKAFDETVGKFSLRRASEWFHFCEE